MTILILLRWILALSILASLAAALTGCGSVAAPSGHTETETSNLLSPTAITATAMLPREGEQPAVVSTAGLQPTKPPVLLKPNPQPAAAVNRSAAVSSPGTLIDQELGPTMVANPESQGKQPPEPEDDKRPETGYVLTPDGTAHVRDGGPSSPENYATGISGTAGVAVIQGQSDPVEGQPYTWEDGDRTLKVLLQSDLTVGDDGEITVTEESQDAVVTRATKGDTDIRSTKGDSSKKRVGSATAVNEAQPVFRSESGELMTLPGGVLLALDQEWSESETDQFFARNGIELSRVSDLGFVVNGFFVETEPGFPSLNLANSLAGQEGVILSSPNWWTEVSRE